MNEDAAAGDTKESGRPLRLLVTGLRGTVAPHLARCAAAAGAEVLGWDRQRAPPDDSSAVARELERLAPDAIAHLGFGPPAWAAQLAAHAAVRRLPLLFTSSAMVFHHEPDGPHAAHDPRNAEDDYGRYKIRCEDAVRLANADAGIVRLGWQMPWPSGATVADGGQNHMPATLDGWLARDDHIAASSAWRPACSFVDHTGAALWAWLAGEQARPGIGPRLWQIDANRLGGHSFAAIAAALGAVAGRQPWPLRLHTDYVHDQRLVGGDAWVPPLAARLPCLNEAV